MFLDKIIAQKRQEIHKIKRDRLLPVLLEEARFAKEPRDFYKALASKNGIKIIAEIKKASPSKGILANDLDVISQAKIYQEKGAAAISVLTDNLFFKGSVEDLKDVKNVVDIPVLRKDFILDPIQVYESRAAGADAILLIASVLQFEELKKMKELAEKLGMQVLIEIHSQNELSQVLPLGPRILGINNRNLGNFKVSLSTTLMVLPLIPEDIVVVSESGIRSRDDVSVLREAGINALLIGEALVKSRDPGKTLADLLVMER